MKKIIASALFIAITTALFAQTKQAPVKTNTTEIESDNVRQLYAEPPDEFTNAA